MHPYLTRLGVRREVHEYFAPYFDADETGNLVFDYGDAKEHFGLAFHRIPVSANCWLAGNLNYNMVSRVFICSSAMEAIAFYHCCYAAYPHPDNLLFVAVGLRPENDHFRWIIEKLCRKELILVFGNGLLDKIAELTTAATLSKLPLEISLAAERVSVYFRQREYLLPAATFSLSSFEKLSGYRFKLKTARAKNGDSYFAQLKAAAFNH